jgi:hypothetical protein
MSANELKTKFKPGDKVCFRNESNTIVRGVVVSSQRGTGLPEWRRLYSLDVERVGHYEVIQESMLQFAPQKRP